VRLDRLNTESPGNQGRGTVPSPSGMDCDAQGTQRPRETKPVGYRR